MKMACYCGACWSHGASYPPNQQKSELTSQPVGVASQTGSMYRPPDTSHKVVVPETSGHLDAPKDTVGWYGSGTSGPYIELSRPWTAAEWERCREYFRSLGLPPPTPPSEYEEKLFESVMASPEVVRLVAEKAVQKATGGVVVNEARPSILEAAMETAKVWSKRSTCNRAKVGAVILTLDGHVKTTGYNGSPKETAHCTAVGCLVVSQHCIRTIHAEENSIDQAALLGESTRDCIMVTTRYPCVRCVSQAMSVGIGAIIYDAPYYPGNVSKEEQELYGERISTFQQDTNGRFTFNDRTNGGRIRVSSLDTLTDFANRTGSSWSLQSGEFYWGRTWSGVAALARRTA